SNHHHSTAAPAAPSVKPAARISAAAQRKAREEREKEMSITRSLTRPITRKLTRPLTSPGAGGGGVSIVNNGVLAPFVTITRASTGTYFDSAGVMQTAAIDEPRVDYDPDTLELRGLLVEGSRTNLWTRSAEFNQAVWVKSEGTTITANAGTAPDGTASADKIIGAVGSGSRYVRQNATLTADGYAASVFAAPAEASWIAIFDPIPNAFAYFNVATGEIGNSLNCTPKISPASFGF